MLMGLVGLMDVTGKMELNIKIQEVGIMGLLVLLLNLMVMFLQQVIF